MEAENYHGGAGSQHDDQDDPPPQQRMERLVRRSCPQTHCENEHPG
jgi:hypothetical protein